MVIIKTVTQEKSIELKNNSSFIPIHDIHVSYDLIGFIVEDGKLIHLKIEDDPNKIFNVPFNDYTKDELFHMLDKYIGDIKTVEDSKVGIRMLLRILQFK